MSRNIQDADLTKSVAIAAAAATAVTASIDLGRAAPAALEVVEVEMSIPILPALIDDKTVICSMEDSADNSTFAALDCGSLTATGTETPGTDAALTEKVRLPSDTRRYIRMTETTLVGAGDNTAVSVTMKVLT